MSARLDDQSIAALIELMWVVCIADRELSREERRRMRERIDRAAERAVGASHFERCIVDAALALEHDGRAGRLEHLRRGPLADPAMRRLALDLALDVAKVDGLAGAERECLLDVCDAFDVPRGYVEARARADGPYRDG